MTDIELLRHALFWVRGVHLPATDELAKEISARLAQPIQPDYSKAGFGQPQPTPAPTDNGRYLTGYKAQPEPVAWMYEYGTDRCDAVNTIRWYPNVTALRKPEGMVRNVVPLYTAPPRKEWQGLTDEERKEVFNPFGNAMDFARAIEAKLKEKNA